MDPFASTSSASDPFSAFSVPTTNAATSSDPFGGRAFSGKPSDLSAFDPFGGSGDPFKVSHVHSDLCTHVRTLHV